jgi:hypothetical protein
MESTWSPVLKVLTPPPDANDFAGGHWYVAVGCLDHAGDDGEVVKIQ